MAKIILIHGAGKGKTIFGNALYEFYRSRGIACKRISVSRLPEIKKAAIENEDFAGFIVMDTNIGISAVELGEYRRIWQTIEIQGGEVLKHADLQEMATEGFGSAGKTLYGISQ